MRLGELEGKGHCANSEGITDTVLIFVSLQVTKSKVILLTCLLSRETRYKEVGKYERGAGSCEGTEKSEDGDERRIRSALYTILILRSHDYLLCIYLGLYISLSIFL